MLSVYPAIFFKESNGYSVIFPDLNYLSTCGETVDEAVSMAVDCLAGHLFWLQQEGETFPTPSDITSVNPVDEQPACRQTFFEEIVFVSKFQKIELIRIV